MFEQKINQLTDNKYGLRLKEATLDKKSGQCLVELFYRDGVVLKSEDKSLLEKLMTENLPKGFTYSYKFIKNYLVKDAVADFAKKYIARQFPSIIFTDLRLDKDDGGQRKIYFKIKEDQLDYAKKRGLAESLEREIESVFMTSVKVELEAAQEEIIEEVEEQPVFEEENLNEGRFISVSGVEPIIGDLNDSEAYYIKDIKTPQEESIFCGKVKFIKIISYIPKKKKAEKSETEGEVKEKKIFKFTLEDFTGKISCTYFPSTQTEPKLSLINEGDSVIVSGKVEEDSYSGGLVMHIKSISRCTLPEKFEEEVTYKPLPEKYRYVFPEPVEHYTQADLFSGETPKVNDFFMHHDVVVYDFETTGTRVDGADKIVEIGAVKVHEGRITESFSCLVNPEMHIPAEATAVHGIKDEDVKTQHTYSEVLADFYKFTHGCYLSGYNIEGFDNLYLNHFGKLSGYNFDNPSIDVYRLAQKGVRGVKNYKLKTIAEKLNVALEHAHRAVNDTIATAEVLFKLSENMEIG